jgi:hypothetical protein
MLSKIEATGELPVEGKAAPSRKWPAPVEAVLELLAAWDGVTGEDPLAVPVGVRRRRRRELATIRRDEAAVPLERARQKRRRRAARDRQHVEAIARAARLAGAVA